MFTMKYFMVVIVSLMVFRHSGPTKSPKSVDEMLSILCPYVDICNTNATSADLTTHGLLDVDTISCCAGCSCHPECKVQHNCCWPNDDSNNGEMSSSNDQDNSMYLCIDTAFSNPGEDLPTSIEAYNTVVRAPTGECYSDVPVNINPGISVQPSCTDNVTRDSYFPVYSHTTGEVYINVQCAICHAVKDYQFSVPVLVCGNRDRFNQDSFMILLYYFDTGVMPPRCYIHFRFSNPRLIFNKRCYHIAKDECETISLKSISRLNITDNDLDFEFNQQLCENGLYSPFYSTLGVYKNVFCFLCGTQPLGPMNLFCDNLNIMRSDNSVFTSLIKPDLYLDKQAITKRIVPEVCTKDNQQLVSDRCYKVFCPTGRMMNNAGKCVFLSNHWSTIPLKIVLKLTPPEGEDYRVQLSKLLNESSYQEALMRGKPWPGIWKLWYSMLRSDNSTCKERANLIVDLRTKGSEDDAATVQDIDKYLRLPWTFEINGTRMVFSQSFLEYEIDIFTNYREPWYSNQRDLVENRYGCGSLIWTYSSVDTFFLAAPFVRISKLFVCQQVQLQQTDYEIEEDKSFIRSNITKYILISYEFNLLHEEDGYTARVCLEDTNLQWITNRGTTIRVIALLASLSLHCFRNLVTIY